MRIKIIARSDSPREVAKAIEPQMRNLGNAIGRRMQRLVPKRTWALHDTIVVGTQRKGSVVTTEIGVGSDDVDYWEYVERGTSQQKAQPYMRPALLQSRQGDLLNGGPLGKTKGQRRADANAKARARRAAKKAKGGDK